MRGHPAELLLDETRRGEAGEGGVGGGLVEVGGTGVGQDGHELVVESLAVAAAHAVNHAGGCHGGVGVEALPDLDYEHGVGHRRGAGLHEGRLDSALDHLPILHGDRHAAGLHLEAPRKGMEMGLAFAEGALLPLVVQEILPATGRIIGEAGRIIGEAGRQAKDSARDALARWAKSFTRGRSMFLTCPHEPS
jgi:hypothetical protein